ncbi:hypothetical protein VZT92_024971 [Zoarces viviparus]|uniref:Uncharacterized protein n=1 Tax=Zoarces viviparus TaxID=48416 RepID=A0AAW1E4S2_ZOAVI
MEMERADGLRHHQQQQQQQQTLEEESDASLHHYTTKHCLTDRAVFACSQKHPAFRQFGCMQTMESKAHLVFLKSQIRIGFNSLRSFSDLPAADFRLSSLTACGRVV